MLQQTPVAELLMVARATLTVVVVGQTELLEDLPVVVMRPVDRADATAQVARALGTCEIAKIQHALNRSFAEMDAHGDKRCRWN